MSLFAVNTRDVILPFVVLRRLDTLLEPTKVKVLEEVDFQKKEMNSTMLEDYPLTQVSGYVFYNTSKWTKFRIRFRFQNVRPIDTKVLKFHKPINETYTTSL